MEKLGASRRQISSGARGRYSVVSPMHVKGLFHVDLGRSENVSLKEQRLERSRTNFAVG